MTCVILLSWLIVSYFLKLEKEKIIYHPSGFRKVHITSLVDVPDSCDKMVEYLNKFFMISLWLFISFMGLCSIANSQESLTSSKIPVRMSLIPERRPVKYHSD